MINFYTSAAEEVDAVCYTVGITIHDPLYSGLDYSDSSTITVTQGQAYGYLPGPTLPEGYNFNGWYTAKEGGQQVTETTVFNGSGNISLYARYSKKPVEVSFAPASDESYAAKEYIGETSACLVEQKHMKTFSSLK